MPKPKKLTPSRVEKFFKHLRETGNVSGAARAIDMTRRRMYELRDENHRDFDPVFKQCWDDAIQEWTDNAEEELHRRAVKGVTEPIMYKGKQVKTVQRYSDDLLKFFLTAHNPDKYLTRHQLRMADADGQSLRQLFGDAVRDVPAEK